jgi:hypothetical protein
MTNKNDNIEEKEMKIKRLKRGRETKGKKK